MTSTTRLSLALAAPLTFVTAMAGAQTTAQMPSTTSSTTTSSAATTASPPSSPQRRAATSANDARPIHELEAAAQRLREAIQVMADAKAGPERTRAMKEANAALNRTTSAMAALPPELLLAGAREPDFQHSMDKLKQAAQDLRDAAHALAAEPAGPARNDSIKRVNKALVDTQQTMIDAYMASSSK